LIIIGVFDFRVHRKILLCGKNIDQIVSCARGDRIPNDQVNAADVHFGGYSIEPRIGTSVLDGIKNFAKGKFEVAYAEGCKITTTLGSFWENDNTKINDESPDLKLISDAAFLASKSDTVLLVIGENESICREGWSENHRGDRDNLELWGRQEELLNSSLINEKRESYVIDKGFFTFYNIQRKYLIVKD
jgi:beta-glucosidase